MSEAPCGDRATITCGHAICLMEEALHEAGKCTEFDQIVLGIYCPIVTCRRKAKVREMAP